MIRQNCVRMIFYFKPLSDNSRTMSPSGGNFWLIKVPSHYYLKACPLPVSILDFKEKVRVFFNLDRIIF